MENLFFDKIILDIFVILKGLPLNSVLPYMIRSGIIAAVMLIFAWGPSLCAQEVRFPDKWQEVLKTVRPLYRQDTLTVRVLGDIMMHSRQIETAYRKNGKYDFSSYFRNIQDRIEGADIAVGNMEFTLAGEPYTGYPSFSAPDSFAEYLAGCGLDVFLLANNHIYDKGGKGAERTLKVLEGLKDEYGISWCGLGNGSTCGNPLIINSQGIRIALINFTYGTNLGIGSKGPKTCYMNNREGILKALKKAESADITIVLPHWGEEYVLHHSSDQADMAAWLAENGADIIIGSHPHVPQDFEHIGPENVPVAYSVGNAVSNMSAANTQLELMATVRIVRNGMGDISLLPVEFTYLWCSRPGGLCSSYAVIPVKEYIGRKEEWTGKWDYDKMVTTYSRVKAATGIEDK